jgi:hypothetical protein
MDPDAHDAGDDQQGERKSSRDRFLRVAARRVETILRTVRLLGNCSNPSSYEYQDHEVRKMFDAIERELQVARAKFEQRQKKRVQFRFEE